MTTLAETFEQAVKLHDAGNLDDADRLYREILRVEARHPQVWHNLGLIAQARGELSQAAQMLSRAVQLDGAQPSYHNNLGIVLQLASRHADATTCYRRALELNPRYAEAHCNLGSVLKDQGQLPEAIACYNRALACNANLPEIHFNLGVIFQGQGQWDQAKACYEKAIELRPSYAEAYNNLGAAFKRVDDLEGALHCYSKALEFKPDFAEPLNNLGNIFQTQGRSAEAVVCYEQSLRINPDYPQAHYNRAVAHLAQGDFATGWREYEWRLACQDFPKLGLTGPRWDGTPLGDRRLLITAEQGLGDTLQFIRYLPLVTRQFGSATVAVQRALIPLLRQSGFENLVAKGDPSLEYDVWMPLLSLPGVFNTTLESIPAAVPYLTADAELVARWRNSLGSHNAFRVGIAWQGSPTYRGDRFRSIPLERFEALALPGVELISLQKGPGREQLVGIAGRFAVRDLGEEVDTDHGAFTDTAAIMQSLDLVITSDSAVAHLAGGLGIEVWLALPIAADWRWLVGREDSPWYPTMRLFRQSNFDAWPEVFERISEALRARLSQDSLRRGE
jgi:tetratricopeptide (TPR) repeat protein